MSARLALALSVLIAGCDRTVPTPVGTVIGEARGLEIRGPGTKHFTMDMRFDGSFLDGHARFRIDFDHGPGEVMYGAPATPHPAEVLRNLRIVVADNVQWAMSANCRDGPAYADVEEDPLTHRRSLQIFCTVKITRNNGKEEYETPLYILASGSVSAPARGAEWEMRESGFQDTPTH